MDAPVKHISDFAKMVEPNTESLAEINAMREDADPRLQEAADIAIDTKVMKIKTENDKALISGAGFSLLSAPLKAVGYAGRKINETLNNLSENQRQRLNEKIQRVVDKNIEITSLPTLAAATEAYLYTEQESDLAELFENLIANSVDSSQKVHPSYVEILKQLSGEEARILKYIFGTTDIPICNIILSMQNGRLKKELYSHLIDLSSISIDGKREPFLQGELPMMVDNWIRLGLYKVENKIVAKFDGRDVYSEFTKRPEYLSFQAILKSDEVLELEKGRLYPTDFGLGFMQAVSQNQP